MSLATAGHLARAIGHRTRVRRSEREAQNRLSEAAEEAVKEWKFKPATLNGEPVDVIFNLTVNFTLQ